MSVWPQVAAVKATGHILWLCGERNIWELISCGDFFLLFFSFFLLSANAGNIYEPKHYDHSVLNWKDTLPRI